MEINIKTIDQVTIVEMAGELDGKTAPQAQEQVAPFTKAGGKIILDMTQVTYMSSAGLRMLLSMYRQLSSNDGRIALVGLAEELKDTMSITGFLSYFTTCDTLEAGLTELSQSPSV